MAGWVRWKCGRECVDGRQEKKRVWMGWGGVENNDDAAGVKVGHYSSVVTILRKEWENAMRMVSTKGPEGVKRSIYNVKM